MGVLISHEDSRSALATSYRACSKINWVAWCLKHKANIANIQLQIQHHIEHVPCSVHDLFKYTTSPQP